MSARGRGPKTGGDLEQNFTPAWCVNRLVEKWQPSDAGGTVIEPGAGDGAIIRALAPHHNFYWHAMEIDPQYKRSLYDAGAHHVTVGDCLAAIQRYGERRVSLVIGNPAFSISERLVLFALRYLPRAEIVLLLRIDFLASDRRHSIVADNPPDIFVLPNRPSFTGDGDTDAQEYAWFRWLPGMKQKGKITVLNLTTKKERDRG